MYFANQIGVCVGRRPYQRRRISQIEQLVIHECNVGGNGMDTAHQFQDRRKYKAGWYTGGKMPYHFFICKNGAIDQCLPISYVGPGAIGMNRSGIQIALAGNFNKEIPTPAQVQSLVLLCGSLRRAFPNVEIVGHTEKPGASKDPRKQCPGVKLNLCNLRSIVGIGAMDRLELEGIVI